MPFFSNDGINIYYEIEGSGPDVILIHGFAANLEYNWKRTNWVDTLKDENRVILMDCRGHGKSDKPLNPALYGNKMIDDVVKLMDHLTIKKANIFGYSMGGRIAFKMLLDFPERVQSAILGGFGLPSPIPDEVPIPSRPGHPIDGLDPNNLNMVIELMGPDMRKFVETTGADLKALAAIMINDMNSPEEMLPMEVLTKKNLRKLKVPIMSVAGSNDFFIPVKTIIAEVIPNACHFQIQGKDHLTVVADPKFHMVVKSFLNFINKN